MVRAPELERGPGAGLTLWSPSVVIGSRWRPFDGPQVEMSLMADGPGSSPVAASPVGPIEPVGRAVDGPAFSPGGVRVGQR